MEILLENGADVNSKDKVGLLRTACSSNVRIHGSNGVLSQWDLTPLHAAAANYIFWAPPEAEEEGVKLLLRKGAKIDSQAKVSLQQASSWHVSIG